MTSNARRRALAGGPRGVETTQSRDGTALGGGGATPVERTLVALEAELRDARLRPLVDVDLELVVADCPDCDAGAADPWGLWRPLQAIPRRGRVQFLCTACDREATRS
jgi:hypothetical protein